jgi:glycosyltransferase involved in cell wall biosynthesis
MKICFISPYIPKHFGGGEKYLLDCARVAAEKHDVFVAIPNLENYDLDFDPIKKNYSAFLGCSLENVQFISTPIMTSANSWHKLLWTKQFDCIYYLTDGSLFFSIAANNVLHIQVPLQLNKAGLIERIKLANWGIKNTNSEFTKKVIERTWQTKINLVHHPMIDIPQDKLVNKWIKHKEKIILNVGRFFTHLHSKRQDVLVETFINMRQQYPLETRDWQLILVGKVEDQQYAAKIKKMSQGQPIKILHQVDRFELLKYYQQASIYWHATGFGLDEMEYPEKMEHFGISTVEAMAHGCLPIVINKGGQVEILGEQLGGFLWDSQAACIDKTIGQINNAKSLQKNQLAAYQRSHLFSEQIFKDKLFSMIGE